MEPPAVTGARIRVIVTGSRHLDDPTPVVQALRELANDHAELTVVHGDCPSGADRHAARWCRTEGSTHPTCRVVEESHPANWQGHGKSAGPIRNRKMVALGADLMLAFPLDGGRGTQHCVRVAAAAGIPVVEAPTTTAADI